MSGVEQSQLGLVHPATRSESAFDTPGFGPESLAEIVNSLPVLIAFIDDKFIYRFVNAAYRTWFQRSPEDIIGKSVLDLVGPAGFAERLPSMRRALGGEPVTVEIFIPHPDGTPRWGEGRLTPRRTETGRVDGFYVFVAESTKRKLAEDALRSSEEWFSRVAECVPVPIWTSRVDGERDFVNQAYLDVLALTDDEASRYNWRAGVHPDDLPGSLKIMAEARAALQPYALEARVLRHDGQWRWFRVASQPVLGPSGRLQGYASAAYDITEAKESEADLRRANEQLEQRVQERTRERDRLWRTSRDIIIVASRDGRWLNVNPAAERLLGWGRDDLLGRTSEWLEHPEDRARTRLELKRHLSGEAREPFESRLITRSGDVVWFSWSAVLDGDLVYCIGRDVSAQRLAAAELEAVEAQLRESQKLEAIGQLTGGIAHDFNNLLTGMIGSLDLMRRRLESGRVHEIGRYITTATAAAERAAALTQRLLAFSRRQALDPQPLDVNELVLAMSDLLVRTLGEAITVTPVLGRELWPAYCDANQLEAAILNFALNARDAMPEGGRLDIATDNMIVMPSDATSDLSAGAYVAIAVSDTGTGIAPHVGNRVFEPFFTTKPVGQGTGLGLSMVYGFAKQSGGHVRIERTGAGGTTFQLFLPRHQAEADMR